MLLALLVISGLAGTLRTGSISIRERKQAVALIKQSRTELVAALANLTPAQFSFQPGPGQVSIKDLITQSISLEEKCLGEIANCMDQSSNPESRLKIELTDEQLLATNVYPLCSKAVGQVSGPGIASSREAILKFQNLRDRQLKYLRTSTEDLRNHVMLTFAGWIDCYQYYLLLADRSSYVAGLIRQIRAKPGFPRS